MYKALEPVLKHKKMNQLTEAIFAALEDKSDQGLIKLKAIFQMSVLAASSGLSDMALDLTASFKPENETYSFSMLAYAIWQKNLGAFDFLISQGLDINLGGPSPLECAILNDCEEMAVRLIDMGASLCRGDSVSTLQFAIKMQSEKLIPILIQKGIDVNFGVPTPLYTAIEQDREDLAILLIQHGADVNLGQPTPLWCAVDKKNKKMAALLLENGAKVDQFSKREIKVNVKIIISEAWKSNKHYYPETSRMEDKLITQYVTPIFQALEHKDIEIAKLLMLNEADLSIKMKNEKYDFSLPDECRERDAENLISRDDKNVQLMLASRQKIKLAKIHFFNQEPAETLVNIGLAYKEDKYFLLDYLSNKIHLINLNCYRDTFPHGYILGFLGIFCFIAKGSGIKFDEAAFSYMQETLLLELNGHDPESPAQEIKLFKNREEKTAYIKQLTQGSKWEQTFLLMQNATGQGAVKETVLKTEGEELKELPNDTKRTETLNGNSIVACRASLFGQTLNLQGDAAANAQLLSGEGQRAGNAVFKPS